MKTYSLEVTRWARQDLRSIAWYLAKKSGSIDFGINYTDRIENNLSRLCVNPHHQIIDEPPFREAGLRRYTIKNYVAYYLIDEDSNRVVVLAVLYGGRFWQRLLPERMRAWQSRRQRTLVRVTARIR
ncbi:type II toxin-antitoxin system RelE/ParE family toxin [bacterium]|nr:type II toxin-antitoxin system RelE/ParE family toxin [bacterium]